MTAAVANSYEQLLKLGDCYLTLDRRHKEMLLDFTGQKAMHLDSWLAMAVAQGLLAAVRTQSVGQVAEIPRPNKKDPKKPTEYFTRVWTTDDERIWLQTQGPYAGPLLSFDSFEAITVVQALISGVRALEGWR